MTVFHRSLRRITAATSLALAAPIAQAQIVRESGLSPFVKDYKIDFAIPDAPAFKLLQVDESAILRPQTVRDLTLAVDGFRGDNNAFVVPKQFAVEVSPGLLIGTGQLKLNDYNAKKFLYATRFSGATGRDSLDRGELAFGVRFSLVDEEDMRSKGAGGTDTAVTGMTKRILDIYDVARDRSGRPPAPIKLNEDEKNAINALRDSVKEYWADHYWNATSVELALAGRALTADTLGHDPKMDEIAGWITYANGLRGWGQLLFGAKVGTARESTGSFHSSNTLAARLYIGSNALKTFVEGQQAFSSTTEPKWLVNSGVEVRLPGVGWINASAGYASPVNGGDPRVISSFKFKTGVPGM
ncbi:MAG TPA: hypothetical protein VGN73_11850 [Gemmatimonadaceae bacterium]|nr:hypothetical protein [Gemmatimonadaceae bacterium]